MEICHWTEKTKSTNGTIPTIQNPSTENEKLFPSVEIDRYEKIFEVLNIFRCDKNCSFSCIVVVQICLTVQVQRKEYLARIIRRHRQKRLLHKCVQIFKEWRTWAHKKKLLKSKENKVSEVASLLYSLLDFLQLVKKHHLNAMRIYFWTWMGIRYRIAKEREATMWYYKKLLCPKVFKSWRKYSKQKVLIIETCKIYFWVAFVRQKFSG